MSLLTKLDALAATHATFRDSARDPTDVLVDEMLTPTLGKIQGRETILAGTNNYLGLTFDPECIAAGQAALASEGTGTTGSRMANGNYKSHRALEQELGEFFGGMHAMVFSTGYAANLGTLTALLEPGDCAMLDADAHASLYDGCRMSGADVFRFKHNDAESLSKRLGRLGERAHRTLIVTEGLFSIMGDTAPLAEIAALTKEHGAYLLVDEAHSVGLYGEHGRGVAEAAGVAAKVDFIVGTFSKSLGSTGGFCVSRHSQLALSRYASRPYIFTASGCPSVIATTRTALRIIAERPALREQVWDNARRLHAGLKALELTIGAEVSPVVGVRFPSSEAALLAWQRLLDAGVYTNLIAPPASPDGTSLLRCSVSAAHTSEQIDTIVEAFRTVVCGGNLQR